MLLNRTGSSWILAFSHLWAIAGDPEMPNCTTKFGTTLKNPFYAAISMYVFFS